ncbi:MAG: TlpA family protein disulfide reductase, partial [Candidatus Coatesbacteria bacterium]
MPRQYLYAPLVVAAVLFAFLGCKPREEGPPPASGEAPPAKGLSGDFGLISASEFNVDDYKGQVLVLDFWATWCGPCKMEIPHLIELQDKYRAQGLVIVGITMDDNPDADVPPYAAEVGMNYVNVRGTEQMKGEYNVIGLPTIVVFDRDGNKVLTRP